MEKTSSHHIWKLWTFVIAALGVFQLVRAATSDSETPYRLLSGIGLLLMVPQTILRRGLFVTVPLASAKVHDGLAWAGVMALLSGLFMGLFKP